MKNGLSYDEAVKQMRFGYERCVQNDRKKISVALTKKEFNKDDFNAQFEQDILSRRR